jgi:hypothetical protein
MVCPLPEYMQLPPNDLENGAPIALMEGIEGSEERIMSLSFVSQGAHIPLKHKIHKSELWRQLGLAGGIPILIGIASLTHVFNDLFYSEHGGAGCPLFF